MRPIALLFLLAAACTTYPDDCNRRALHQLRTVERLIEEARANLARGYTYEVEEQGFRSGFVLCSGGSNVRFCTSNEPAYRRRAVAIDPAAERRSLELLLSRREALLPLAASCQPI